ncbi:MAG: acetyl-CoA carboxylase biotin carboxyl carrier protein [Tropicimonas sp.]|uniref:acetyl-CoA carboxylase biotin carboxyl carrier protein n=1 Tax=Tropicimonas sp. TaxID=2067044 RepID=UPI003A89E450
MDMNRVRQIIDWFAGSGLESFELAEGGNRIRLDRPPGNGGAQPVAPAAVQAGPTPQTTPQTTPEAAPVEAQALPVEAPLYGICFFAPAPDAPPFVRPGQAVKAGETLCLMEAMKVLNAVTAPRDGVVAEILVQDGAEVEQGQPLLILT